MQALALSDAQLVHIQQSQGDAANALNAGQRERLKEIEAVLSEAHVYEAVALGLIPSKMWAGGYLCSCERSFGSLNLSGAQVQELQRLGGSTTESRLKVLTEFQRKRLASYEAKLQLVNQAIELKLTKPRTAERLCH